MTFTRNHKIIAGITCGLALVLGLLWYFQSQGILKVFPTAEDRRISGILKIDESKFKPPVGISDEDFQKQIKEVYVRRDRVKQNPQDAQAWFLYGYQLDFLNDREKASAAWERTLELQPLNFVAATNLASTYQYFLKNFPRAEFYYKLALESQPAHTQAYQGLADLYRYNLKDRKADLEPTLLVAVQNDPAHAVTYWSILVEFFADDGNISKAKDYLSKIDAVNKKAADGLLENYSTLK